MGIIAKFEKQARKRKRDWAILRLAGYKLEPISKKWFKSKFSQSEYVRYDGSLKHWCWAGEEGHGQTCRALNSLHEEHEHEHSS